MNRRASFALVAAACLTMVAASQAKPPAHKGATPKDVVMTADRMEFKQIGPGVTKSVLWGDPAKGPYATITRFSRGFKAGKHYHSANIKVVVISGTFVYDAGNGEQRLKAGSYVYEPKGKQHSSSAGDSADCVFLEEGDGAFDMIKAK